VEVEMPVQLFEDDAQYQKWLAANPSGYVVNPNRSHAPRYMVLQRASCKHSSEPVHETEPGGFTERQYIKVCASDVQSLRTWVADNGRPDGTFSNECGNCKPTAERGT
jgi:hypothetical protein